MMNNTFTGESGDEDMFNATFGNEILPTQPMNFEEAVQAGRCMKCGEQTTRSMKVHIRLNKECRQTYQEALNIYEYSDKNEIYAQIMAETKKVKRKNYPSRSSEARQNETRRRTERHILNHKEIYNRALIQMYSNQESLFCIFCCRIKPRAKLEEIPADRNPRNIFHGKSFKCSGGCYNTEDSGTVTMTQKLIQGKIYSLPKRVLEDENVLIHGDVQDSEMQSDFVAVPRNSQCLLNFNGEKIKLPRKAIEDLKVIPFAFPVLKFPESLYENQVQKIHERHKNNVLQTGRILDEENKKISIQRQLFNLSRICGTDDYYRSFHQDLETNIIFHGDTFLKCRIELPSLGNLKLEQLAHEQRHECHVEVKFADVGISPSLCTAEVKIHSNHNEEEVCDEASCNLKDSREFRFNDEKTKQFENGTSVQTTASFVEKYRNVASDMICKISNSELFSTILKFEEESLPVLKGVFWPTVLQKAGREIQENAGFLKLDTENEVSTWARKTLTASTKPEVVADDFGLSSSDAELVTNIAKTKQTTDEFSFPSKITHLKQGHDMNVVDPVLREQETRSFKHLQQLLKTRIEQFLTDGENQEKTLDTFIARLISQKDFSLIVTEQEWSITLPEMGTFKFKMDSLMKNFLKFFDTEIEAAYHRIIFFRGDSNLELVFKREMEEVNIIPYNPFVSLLTQSRTEISVVSTNQKKTVDEMLSKARKIPEELEFMENTHDFVSILEGIFLLDSSKSLVYRNARPIFCSLQGDRPRTFKKSTENSEEDYICVKSSQRFRLLSDLHNKY